MFVGIPGHVWRQQQQRPTHVSENLTSCPFVIVRHDGVKRALQPPYDGPYRVLKHSDKHYMLDFCGHHKVVSLDRLKSAYFDDTASPDTSFVPPTLTITSKLHFQTFLTTTAT